eukprot:32418_2
MCGGDGGWVVCGTDNTGGCADKGGKRVGKRSREENSGGLGCFNEAHQGRAPSLRSGCGWPFQPHRCLKQARLRWRVPSGSCPWPGVPAAACARSRGRCGGAAPRSLRQASLCDPWLVAGWRLLRTSLFRSGFRFGQRVRAAQRKGRHLQWACGQQCSSLGS